MPGHPCQLVATYFQALNARELESLRSLVTPDFVIHHSGRAQCLAEFQQMLREFVTAFPDLQIEIQGIIYQDGNIAARTQSQGTHLGSYLGHAPSGRRFCTQGQIAFHLEGGLFAEAWDVFDTITMLFQLQLYQPQWTAPTSPAQTSPAPTSPAPISPVQTSPVQTSPAQTSTVSLAAVACTRGVEVPGPQQEFSLEEVRGDSLRFLENLTSQFGEIASYHCNGRRTILLNDPDAVKHVLHDNSSNYSKASTPDMRLLRPMLGDGLLTTEGARWKSDRTAIQPLFDRGHLAKYAEVIVRKADDFAERWLRQTAADETLNLVRETSRLTLEIAASAFLSTDLGERSEDFAQAMDVLNESMGNADPSADSIQSKFQPALQRIRQLVWECILARHVYDPHEEDLISVLLKMQRERGDTHEQVIDQAMTILLAGHETTAKALAWAFALLDAHADVSQRLLDEHMQVRSLDDSPYEALAQLPYTRAVVHEVLRLYPPVWSMTRTPLHADEIQGYAVPADALIIISPFLLHRNPRCWDNSQAFVPERFLHAAPEAACRPFAYLPFGHGPRLCIGKQFALMELPLILATVHRQVTLQAASRDGLRLVPEALVTLRPKGPLRMRCVSRSLPSVDMQAK